MLRAVSGLQIIIKPPMISIKHMRMAKIWRVKKKRARGEACAVSGRGGGKMSGVLGVAVA